MSAVALTGADTCIMFARSFTDFGKGDVVKIDYENDFVKVEQGKNGNTVYTTDNSGKVVKITMKLIRGSPDDQFMSYMLSLALADLPTFVLGDGTFVKRIGQGDGSVVFDTYTLGGISPVRLQDAMENTDGEPDQAQVTFILKAASSPRSQQ
jgi:hypothetical protein